MMTLKVSAAYLRLHTSAKDEHAYKKDSKGEQSTCAAAQTERGSLQ